MDPAVVLSQDPGDAAGPVCDGATTDLAARDRQLDTGHYGAGPVRVILHALREGARPMGGLVALRGRSYQLGSAEPVIVSQNWPGSALMTSRLSCTMLSCLSSPGSDHVRSPRSTSGMTGRFCDVREWMHVSAETVVNSAQGVLRHERDCRDSNDSADALPAVSANVPS
jgi:hypothetical protein